MRLFELFGKGRIAPSWQYEAKSWLWHIRPTDAGTIVGEERDPERKEAAFFCINSDTGQLLWRDDSFGDRWWTGLEAVHRDIAFLHGFVTPEMPQHRGITAVDLFTGKKLWQRPELRYAGARGEELLAAAGDPGSERYCIVSRATGETRHTVEQEEAAAFVDESGQLQDEPLFPVPVEIAAAEDASLEVPVRASLVGVPVAGPVAVLTHGRRMALTYHEQVTVPHGQQPLYNNVLRIVDRVQGKDLFAAVLDNAIASLVPESFFVQRATLFCIRDRRTLVALPLGSPDDTTVS